MARAAKKTAPAALKLKTCSKLVRVGAERVKCGKNFLGDERNCPNSGAHLNPIKTGFCSNGWCEGSKATDWRGRPVPTCTFIATCPCECHDAMAKLFVLTGSERIVVESSGYEPPKSEFVMPEGIVDDTLSSPDATDTPRSPREPVYAPTVAASVPSYAPTPTGRAARGQLEAWVEKQCLAWMVGDYSEVCSPVWISREIARDEGVPPPSVGAINAVFERWMKLGYAVIAKKPVRFIELTDRGAKLGLARMKADAKKAERMRKAQLKRGALR